MDKGQVINSNHNSANNSQMQSHTFIDNNESHSGSKGSNVSNISWGNKWVVNLSKSPLTPAQESLLSRGPDFALAPTNPPNVKFISAVESACQNLLEQDVQELRAEINHLLKQTKIPRSNITKDEKRALKELRKIRKEWF